MHENYQDIIEKWREKRIQTREDYIQSLSSYSIVFAYNSGVIENPEVTYHNTREIFENGKVVNFTGDLRTLYEIENQKKCYEFILDKISDKAPISRELILQIHKDQEHLKYMIIVWQMDREHCQTKYQEKLMNFAKNW